MAITYRFRSRSDESLKELKAPRAGVWIDASGITENDVEQLAATHGLDAGLLKDAQDFFEAPRSELEDGVLYFFDRYPVTRAGEITTAPILLAVGKDFVLTAVHEKPEWLTDALSTADTFTTQKTKMFLQVQSGIVREYNRVFGGMRRDVRRSRQNVRDVNERTIEDSVQLEYALNEFVSALVPANTALENVVTGKHLHLFAEDLDLLEDLQLANAQLIESAKNTLRTIQNIRDAHMTIVSNRLNQVVRRLTSLTILLTIPTIIGTLYGMNVDLPWQHSVHAFTFIVVATLVLVAGAAYLFIRNKWL